MSTAAFKMIADKVQQTMEGAIENRLKDLAAAGYTLDDVSLRHEDGATYIFVLGETDSKFWISHEGMTVKINGESVRGKKL